jgi:ABC-2 type transport system ATP-binding protein
MAVTATDVVVIGRGKLIRQCSTQEFVEQASGTTVRVRSPQIDRLRALVNHRGWASQADGADALLVSGVTIEEVGELAGLGYVVLHELAAQRGSLEEAFLQLTGDDIEFRAEDPERVAAHQLAQGQTS